MILVLSDLLSAAETAALREAAAALPFEDGRATAGRIAREVKANAQAAETPAREAVLEKARRAMLAHEVFVSAARPRRFARLLVSRHGPGQSYGTHVDDAVMGGARTDLSFTLFLSDPADYDGGALVIEDALEARSLRPGAGEMVLYPSDTLHRVEPVTRGERLAVVGWVTSWVRDPRRREILFDLDVAVREVLDREGKTPLLDRLAKTRSNLLRMWAEG